MRTGTVIRIETMAAVSVTAGFIIALASVVRGDQTIVDTQYGRLGGLEMRSRDSPVPVMAFLGIPYARAPVGDLRLALPQQPSPWKGERDATQYGPICPQDIVTEFREMLRMPDREQSEDCLNLDVYTPGLSSLRPVLVVIHGGGYIFGSSTWLVNGTALAAHENIVVVSMNYRLGALGNLYDADGAWPSNLGLRDQQFALRWVQDNIAAFGGDPDMVTLNGVSAGSLSVSHQILAASSQGLFQRAYSQSGTVFTIFSTKDPQDRTDQCTAVLGCSANSSQDILVCLRQKTVEVILSAQREISMWEQVWDGDFLPADPFNAYNEGAFHRVDYLLGVTSNEGFPAVNFFAPEVFSPTLDLETVVDSLSSALDLAFGRSENVPDMVSYLLGKDAETQDIDWLRQRTADIIGEYVFYAPTYLTAKLHSAHVSNTYVYEFGPQPSVLAGELPSWSRGCEHARDTLFLFGFPLLEGILAEGVPPMTEEESAFSKVVMKYIANFVKMGNPNGEGLPQWKPFSVDEENYQILQPHIDRGNGFRPEYMKFWTEKLQAIRKQDVQIRYRDEL